MDTMLQRSVCHKNAEIVQQKNETNPWAVSTKSSGNLKDFPDFLRDLAW
jgi:hypothetical protein